MSPYITYGLLPASLIHSKEPIYKRPIITRLHVTIIFNGAEIRIAIRTPPANISGESNKKAFINGGISGELCRIISFCGSGRELRYHDAEARRKIKGIISHLAQ